MKKGFFLTIILIAAAIAALYFVITHTSQAPSQKTQNTANSIFKYPNAKSWQVDNRKTICTFSLQNCNAGSQITFDSDDSWDTIFTYYRDYLPQYGWASNTAIYTSIPSSLVLTNQDKCEADLKPTSSTLANLGHQTNSHIFTFSVFCP